MTDPKWYWAEASGAPQATSVAALRASLSLSALPSFVLVWHTGLREWLPAYLMAEFGKVLGVESIEMVELDPTVTEPPPAPVEWYVECYGGPPPASLAEPAAGMAATHDMRTGKNFDPQQMKTVVGQRKALPIGAFRNVDAYLRHIRQLRGSG